jgi:glycosyltransferase involved in cell wall biosynthesis
MPKISVVMPVYNGECYVHSTLETLLDQTYKDWEAIIIDGGSTDGTLALLDEYARQNQNIHVFRERCESPYQAIELGLKKAQGEFVYILCFSDGYLTNDWYALCMEAMKKDPDLSLVWGIPFDLFDDPKHPGEEILRPHYIYSHFLEDGGHYKHGSVIKRILEKVKLSDPSSIIRFVKKINRANITAVKSLMSHQEPPAKQQWFSYWLETGTIFPDGNMCVAKDVLIECIPPYKGGKDVGNWEELFFAFNAKGYLSRCIPIPANFGRLNSGRVSEIYSKVNDRNRRWYFAALKKFKRELGSGTSFSFRDRKGDILR